MSEFCVNCASKDASLEIVHAKHYEEVQQLKKRISELELLVDSLTLDLAFYEGHITNLSCNGK